LHGRDDRYIAALVAIILGSWVIRLAERAYLYNSLSNITFQYDTFASSPPAETT